MRCTPAVSRGASERVYCNKLQTGIAPARQPMFERSQQVRTVGSRPAEVAVVHEDDLPAWPVVALIVARGFARKSCFLPAIDTDAAARGDGRKTFDQTRRGVVAPIIGAKRPHNNRTQARRANGAPKLRPAIAKRRAHTSGRRMKSAESSKDTVLASFEFVLDAPGGHPGEIGMLFGVIADAVAAVGDFAHEFGTGAGMKAHKKKRGRRAIAFQNAQESRRAGRIGTVIEGQGEREIAGSLVECGAKELRSGINGTPRGHPGTRGDGCRKNDGPGVHDTRETRTAFSHAQDRWARVTFRAKLASKLWPGQRGNRVVSAIFLGFRSSMNRKDFTGWAAKVGVSC